MAFLVAPAAVPVALTGVLSATGGTQGASFVLILAAYICYGHALILGVPLYIWLRRSHRASASAVLIASFFIGALPMAVLSIVMAFDMARSGGSYISNGAALFREGIITRAGVIEGITSALGFGVLGAITGLVWLLLAGGFREQGELNAS